MLWLGEDAGLRWTADIVPLDRETAIQAMIAGRELYTVAGTLMTRYRTGQPAGTMHASHGCPSGAARALEKASPGPSPQPTPPGPSAGRTAPFSGPQTGHSSVRSAERHRSSRSEPCHVCRKPVILDGPEQHVAIELGATVIWAQHEICP